jgi:tRNA modification GTPase
MAAASYAGRGVAPSDDLIVAPATPPGRGALALIRLSGPGSIETAAALSSGRALRPRVATRARLALAGGLVEDAIVTAFVAPASFTGEDVVEITTHGSPVIVDAVLRACLERGARLARPGEFTFRAYLNGRLDLLQAEAVDDLIAATTPAQLRVASAHLEGTLSARVRRIGDGIAELRVLLEASLDFPDEGFHFITPAALVEQLGALSRACEEVLGTADAGRRLHDGAIVVIAGRPNAGKSSLFNALLKRQRAIVTAVPGTTRDLLTETTSFGGVPVTLVDTAGLRATTDVIEREGVIRAEESLETSDIVVLVVDPEADADDAAESERLWTRVAAGGALCVLSKRDCWATVRGDVAAWAPDDAIAVSAATGQGVDVLEDRLARLLGRTSWSGETLTRARHRSLMTRCGAALERAVALAAGGGSEEFLLADLQDALTSLEELRGVETPDEVLETIFSAFCIGK